MDRDFVRASGAAWLLDIAHRDTGQSRRVAGFLLAWHNAEEMAANIRVAK